MASVTLQTIKGRCSIDPDTECWNWANCIQGNGYGRIRYDGKTRYVHRLAFELTHGSLPKGKDICHSCDNRKCCNPDHLFSGSRLENMRDCQAKGRVSRGLLHSVKITPGIRTKKLNKLSLEKAKDIRRKHAEGKTTFELAREYVVDVSSIRLVIAHKTWKERSSMFAIASGVNRG